MPVTREEKMTVWDRRVALLEYLQENERATVDELMNELNVSRRTVLRDVTALTQKHAVETVRGRYGGVYLSKKKREEADGTPKADAEGASDRCKPRTTA